VARVYTVDASVFLNAFNPYESGHEESYRFLARIRGEPAPIVVPTLLLPEVAAAVARGREDATLAREFAATLGQLSNVVLIPLDAALAQEAVNMAAQHRLRGSDAVYVAVAQRFGSVLVTRDREQRERIGALLMARTPAEALPGETG